MLKEVLKNITAEKKRMGMPDFVMVNFLKEAIQFPVLNFIYNSSKYKNFIFTGGSCLRICYGLPRLSEDLDFDLLPKEIKKLDLKKMGEELTAYFKNDFLMDLSYRCQGTTRLYMKFPILKELGLSYGENSDYLYVKIEPTACQFKKFETELTPVSSAGFNLLVNNYNLKFLMTGKIAAILEREWFKGKNNEVNIKGRDYYDLYWYLNKDIKPDFSFLAEKFSIGTDKKLKQALWEKIDKEVDAAKLSHDLKNFFSDQPFITNFCRNYKKIIKKYLV